MGNCLSKCDNERFTLHKPQLTSGHLKKIVNDIKKSHVKYSETSIHQNYEY